MPHEVFVSYSQPDRACALELVSRLEAQGVGVWVAPRDVAPAADWAAAIIDALAGARLMALVFSQACNESPHVRREVERAVHRQLADEIGPEADRRRFIDTCRALRPATGPDVQG